MAELLRDLKPARHAGAGSGGRRRCPWVLGGAARCFRPPAEPSVARAIRPPTCWTRCPRAAHSGEAGAGRDERRRGPRARRPGPRRRRRLCRKYPSPWPRSTADHEPLLAHFAFPAEHGSTSDHQPVESTFATVRLRPRGTKGPLRTRPDAMAFKLLEQPSNAGDGQRPAPRRPRPGRCVYSGRGCLIARDQTRSRKPPRDHPER